VIALAVSREDGQSEPPSSNAASVESLGQQGEDRPAGHRSAQRSRPLAPPRLYGTGAFLPGRRPAEWFAEKRALPLKLEIPEKWLSDEGAALTGAALG